MGYYSTLKINATMKFSGKWIDLEKIKLSEATQTQKYNYYMLFLTHVS